MVTASPFAFATNALLTFQVSSGALVADRNGNMRPATATVQVQAMLDQSRRSQVERRPGVDTSAIFLEGNITAVVGAEPGRELILPSVITPDSPCSCIWGGRQGRFWLEFKAPDAILEALGIYLLAEIQGWFLPSSFVISGEPWMPTPTPEEEILWIEITESQTLSVNKGYWYNGNALGLLSLPLSPALGDRIIVQRVGAANWRIIQRPGEQIQVFEQTSTEGETGNVSSTDTGSSIEILFDGSSWVAIAVTGNIEVI